MKEKLAASNIDLIVSATKSVVGVIPYAGPLLSEIVHNLIPNQRVDRLEKYVIALEGRLNKFDDVYIEELLKDREAVGLFEEGFISASRATSENRHEYIASLVGNGISEDRIEFVESQYLLSLLNEINDIEIIWLRFYNNPEFGGDVAFREKHQNVLEPICACLGDGDDVINKESIQNSYQDHLERLQLIKSHVRFDRKTKLPEYDSFTGKPKVDYRSITPLGRLLLKQIGFQDLDEG